MNNSCKSNSGGHANCGVSLLTQNTSHQRENDGHYDEGPVPAVRPGHCRHSQEDKDECVAHAAPHLQEVLDGGVGFMGYVGLHVGTRDGATRY